MNQRDQAKRLWLPVALAAATAGCGVFLAGLIAVILVGPELDLPKAGMLAGIGLMAFSERFEWLVKNFP